MSGIIPFGQQSSVPSVLSDIFAGVQTLERKHFESFPSLSFRGGKFHGTLNGQTTTFMDSDGVPANKLDIIVVGVPETRARVLFPPYDAEKAAAPLCSAVNGRTPDKNVLQPFGTNCQTCEKTIKVRDEKGHERSPCQQIVNLAVVVQGHGDTVWKLKLPITSVYHKESENSDYRAWDQLVDFLRKNNVIHPAQVVLRCTFSSNDQFPRLGFKPIGHLSEEMLKGIAPILKSKIVREITFGTEEQLGTVEGSETSALTKQPVQQIAAPVATAAPTQAPTEAPKPVVTEAPTQAPKVEPVKTEADIRAELEAKMRAEFEAKMRDELEAKMKAEMAAATQAEEKPKKTAKPKPVVVEDDAQLTEALSSLEW